MLTTTPISIALGASSRVGRLVMQGEALLAVLSQTTGEDDPDAAGTWLLVSGVFTAIALRVRPRVAAKPSSSGVRAVRVCAGMRSRVQPSA